jgi:hypothetical protein
MCRTLYIPAVNESNSGALRLRTDIMYYSEYCANIDRLCGLVVRVLDYTPRGPGFDSRALQKK